MSEFIMWLVVAAIIAFWFYLMISSPMVIGIIVVVTIIGFVFSE